MGRSENKAHGFSEDFMRTQPSQLPDILKRTGILSSADLERVFQEQQQWGGRFAPLLVEMGLVREDFLVKTLSRELRLPIATLDGMRQIDPEALRRVPVGLCERFDVMPIGIERGARQMLKLAMSDPTETHVLQEIHQQSSMEIQVFVGGVTAIRRAVRIYFYGESTAEVLRVVPDAFPDPSQASLYASGARPSSPSFVEVPYATGGRHPASYNSVPSVPNQPPHASLTPHPPVAGAKPQAPPAPMSYPPRPPAGVSVGVPHVGGASAPVAGAARPRGGTAALVEDDWASGSSFLQEEVRGRSDAPLRVDAASHSYTGLSAVPPQAGTKQLEQEMRQLQAELREMRERHQKDLQELQQAMRIRIQEQRALVRGLLDILVTRGLVRREELEALLEQVAKAAK